MKPRSQRGYRAGEREGNEEGGVEGSRDLFVDEAGAPRRPAHNKGTPLQTAPRRPSTTGACRCSLRGAAACRRRAYTRLTRSSS